MDVGLKIINKPTEEQLQFAKQLGVEKLVIELPEIPGDGYWEFLDLLRLKERIESEGLDLIAIENMPREWYEKIRLGLEGKDEQIENIRKTITNMGKAGINMFGYDWMLVGVWRTGIHRGRGGALVDVFDYDAVREAPLPLRDSFGRKLITEGEKTEREITEGELWSNYQHFLEKVLPAAEQAGVKMALHPDDPPVSPLAETSRIFTNLEALEKAMSLVDSDFHCLEFCQGTIAEMGVDIPNAIRRFGSRGKIGYVHFRNIRGTVPKFEQPFIDEGDVDMAECIQAYREVNFEGILLPDHAPDLTGDTPWLDREKAGNISWYELVGGFRSKGYATGYIKGLLSATDKRD